MPEFKLDRFKYNWRGSWDPGNEYQRDDIVGLNGKSYVCLIGHTASANFSDDLNAVLPGSDPVQPQPRWVLMTTGLTFRGNWETATEYNINELVYYKGSVYLCEQEHVSSVFSSDRNNWGFFAFHIDYLGNWNTSTDYADGSVVKYNGIVYKCLKPHSSQQTLEEDENKWQVFFNGIQYRGSWTPEQEYRTNDLVKFGASIYRCTETHISQETETVDDETGETAGSTQETVIGFDRQRFQIEIPGFQYESEWDEETEYQIGDIVKYGGTLYYAVQANINSSPFQDAGSEVWIEFSSSYNFQGTWNIDSDYNPGDIVQRGGNLYVAQRSINQGEDDASSLDYIDPDWWELLIPGSVFSNEWHEGTVYSVGEVVYYEGTAYRCNFEHLSDFENFPGDNGNIYDYWDIVIQAGQRGALRKKGDVLSYGLTRTIVGDDSSEGDIRVPIGDENDVLSVTEDLEVFWRTRENNSSVIYVSENGIDDDTIQNQGLVPERPFRTIRHASEYIQDNFEALDLTKISIATGRFEEIAPIIVPAGCVVMGDELRSTKIVANSPLTEYQDDFQYVQDYLDYLTTFITPVLRNEIIEPTEGNTEEQKTDTTTTDVDGVNAILDKLDVFENRVEFVVADGDANPERNGSNEINQDENKIQAGESLLENKHFIAAEIYAWLVQEYPEANFNKTRIENDIYSIFRGVALDLRFSGNHRTLLAAQRYINAVTGSQDEDLFHMRDTTGLRQCTVDGLLGELEEPQAGDRYRRATGGAYVALDPGWGPDDETTWIINRSPYIQGVTTLGTGCVGKKIDGTLHNGGNRSMVSNDFTQVLSDGIGAWVTDGGRAELVSVFTYYATVGYLTERGGIIRATNGNNSYGRFGSVADGNNPTETPQTVSVNNRTNQAQVADAFAGGDTDEIFVFEYVHTGEQYSQAETEIIGAGDFAEVEFSDFRDGAISQARIINTTGSGQPGGSGYLVEQGFAQETVNSQDRIILSSNDPVNIDETYIGQRIIIFAGEGAGQYGYIFDFDPSTKEAQIYRESDDTPGWDHIIPGTPIKNDLNSTAQYRIEPRLEAPTPGFSVSSSSSPAATTFADLKFGNTSATFENITIGEGSSNPNDVFVVENAVFTINRTGREYSAVLTDSGAGYEAGDEFVILGTDLDGASPENDVTITVTEVTDDSTNSIVDFDISGTGRPGRFIALNTSNSAFYSDTGENFTQVFLPFTATSYVALEAAQNKFIAVAQAENRIATTKDGETWSEVSLPETENWSDIAYGDDTWVMIADNTNTVLYSADGESWQTSDIPEDTVADSTGDSTVSSYTHLAYGKGKFVAVSSSDLATAVSEDGVVWQRIDGAIPEVGEIFSYDFIGLEYGDNRFVALASDGTTFYSFDGESWLQGDTVPANVGTPEWRKLRYQQGIFFAIATDTNTGVTTQAATSEYGVTWQSRSMASEQDWSVIEYGYAEDSPKWVALANQEIQNGINIISAGRQAKLRADVFQGVLEAVKIWDPGSGYSEPEGNGPTSTQFEIEITDSQFTVEAELDIRLGNGSLAQPDFVNRGSGYQTATSQITVSGDGFADIIPEDDTLILEGVTNIPGIGAQIRIEGILEELEEDEEGPADQLLFTAQSVTDLGEDSTGNGTRLVEFTINPNLDNEFNLSHGTEATIREGFSQVRLTNHDFLDIGTGNFNETGYPNIYADGAFFQASPENEQLEENGGRVFFTSTDQDGNFRAGDLFAVEQATGVITISAEFFDFSGLTELALGGIRLGGSGTVVREFSTDPRFTQDSDNVVPTQRAISEFLANRLSVGGENIETNDLLAGRVQLGTVENRIDNVAGQYLRIPVDVNIAEPDSNGNPSAIGGTIISQQLFFRDDNDTTQ